MNVFRQSISYVFLRLYGRALSRSRRNDPETAYSDAVMQTTMFVGLPIISTLWLLTALLSPAFAEHLTNFDATFLLPTIGLTLLVGFWISKTCKQYVVDPSLVARYQTPRTRGLTRMMFVFLPVLWLLIVGIALHQLKSRG
jgi:hypothetical protein